MKLRLALFLFVFTSLSIFSQTPEKMSFQAIIRNASGDLEPNKAIGMRISILQGTSTGTAVYSESHSVTTNANGLVTLEIGMGSVISGSFTTIDWAASTYYIKHETDLEGGSNYTITGTSQFLSVPYALNAKSAENVFSGNYDDLTNKPKIENIVTYSVGDFAQGGIVVWVDDTKQHGLVCSNENLTAASWGTFIHTQARGDGLYAGADNTTMAVTTNFDNESNKGNPGLYAARTCRNYSATQGTNTYGDWYLPSKYELNLIYASKSAINTTASANSGQALLNDAYWSSTEINDQRAEGIDLTNGQAAEILKTFSNNIRAVRRF